MSDLLNTISNTSSDNVDIVTANDNNNNNKIDSSVKKLKPNSISSTLIGINGIDEKNNQK